MRRKIGTVDVDSGILMLGDPCYIKDGFESKFKPGEGWVRDSDAQGFGPNYDGAGNAALRDHYQMNHENGHAGFAVAFNTAYGDGTYPVYAEIRDGRVQSVTVDCSGIFDDEDEDD